MPVLECGIGRTNGEAERRISDLKSQRPRIAKSEAVEIDRDFRHQAVESSHTGPASVNRRTHFVARFRAFFVNENVTKNSSLIYELFVRFDAAL